MSWAVTVVATTTAYGAYSANESAKANNRAVANAQKAENARRNFKSKISQDMLTQQDDMLQSVLTDTALQYAKAKGSFVNMAQGSSNSSTRALAVMRTKASEQKTDIIDDAITRKTNIINDMLAGEIDYGQQMMNLDSQRKNVFMSTLSGALGGAQTGLMFASAGKSLGGSTPNPQSTTGLYAGNLSSNTGSAGALNFFGDGGN